MECTGINDCHPGGCRIKPICQSISWNVKRDIECCYSGIDDERFSSWPVKWWNCSVLTWWLGFFFVPMFPLEMCFCILPEMYALKVEHWTQVVIDPVSWFKDDNWRRSTFSCWFLIFQTNLDFNLNEPSLSGHRPPWYWLRVRLWIWFHTTDGNGQNYYDYYNYITTTTTTTTTICFIVGLTAE